MTLGKLSQFATYLYSRTTNSNLHTIYLPFTLKKLQIIFNISLCVLVSVCIPWQVISLKFKHAYQYQHDFNMHQSQI